MQDICIKTISNVFPNHMEINEILEHRGAMADNYGFFTPVGEHSFKKKSRKTVTPDMQKRIWNTHIGTGVKEVPCPLCGINIIKCPNNRCALENAHIVCDKFFMGEPSPLSLYPSCASCNNRCGEECILDFLFSAGRWKQLEDLIRSVHATFVMQNSDLPPERLFMHEVMDHLYGWERYKAGGGIVNEFEIYNIARSLHMKELNQEIAALNDRMREKMDEMEMLSKCKAKRRGPPSIC